MLTLNSPRWLELADSSVHAQFVIDLIRSLASDPTEEDWAEMGEQIAHQGTLASVAYAAFPHLVSIAKAQGRFTDPNFLICVRRVAAPTSVMAPCPEDLRPTFTAALSEARELVIAVASHGDHPAEDYIWMLEAAAALDGRLGPGMNLGETLHSLEPALECPACGAYLLGEISEDSLHLWVSDDYARCPSKKVRGVPRQPATAEDPSDDYSWLAALCRTARQHQVLGWITQLYGTCACPGCGVTLSVMQEVERY